jgi:UDP-N-acetylmuramate--alanine ligase
MQIFISGVGGSGLSSLAHLCLDLGFNVVGSDPNHSPNIDKLISRGLIFDKSQDPDFLEKLNRETPFNYYIYTPALRHDHPEKLKAANLQIPSGKQNFLINEIIKLKSLKLIAVAGTHGKTTTTAMIVWILNHLNIPISYVIGTEIGFGNSGQYQSNSQFLIYEADEYDRKFLDLSPEISLITSLDYDHPDTYPTQESYYQAFRDFIDHTHQMCYVYDTNSFDLLSHQDSQYLREWVSTVRNKTFLISLEANRGEIQKNIKKLIKLPGRHNRLNGYLALQAVLNLFYLDKNFASLISDFDLENKTSFLKFKRKIADILNDFPGTTRRFEKIIESVFSDYAHHPTEIAATLQLASEYIKINQLGKKLVIVYQPHQNARQYQIMDDYAKCFKLASKIYWLPTYLSRENPEQKVLTATELTKNIENSIEIEPIDFGKDLFDKVLQEVESNSLVLLLGAGSIDSWFREKLKTI